MALGWLIATVVMVVTIVGLPWAPAAFNIAWYTLLPFGQTVVSREDYTGLADTPIGFIGNLIWLVFAGWWLALGHLVTAALLAVTIIGLPFAWAHLKLAGLAALLIPMVPARLKEWAYAGLVFDVIGAVTLFLLNSREEFPITVHEEFVPEQKTCHAPAVDVTAPVIHFGPRYVFR